MSGRIIVVEGLDGVGKTTLSQGLAQALGAAWMTTPGAELRPHRKAFDEAYAQDVECSQLFYAASVLSVGRAATRRTGDVVIDRYWSSTRAYAGGSALGLKEVEDLLPPADLTLVVELEESERWRRLHARGMSMLDARTAGEEGRRIAGLLRAEGPWSGRVWRLSVDGLRQGEAVAAALALVEGMTRPA